MQVSGLSENDTIYRFGTGNDSVTENAGDDTLLFGAGYDLSNITVQKHDEGSAWNTTDNLVISDGNGNSFTFNGHFDTQNKRLEQLEFNDGTVVSLADLAIESHGSENNDSIDGIDAGEGLPDDTIYGYGGNDNIYVGLGDDTIDGGAGNDYIDSGAGDDNFGYTLTGNETSSDTYQGGAGTDTLALYLSNIQYTLPLWNEIQDYRDFFAQNYNTSAATGTAFNFAQIGLSVSTVEALDVYVDGILTTDAPVIPEQPPVAYDDLFDGQQDQNVSGNVLDDNGNGADADINGDVLTATPETKTTSQGGSVTINADGSFVYTPISGFTGTDSFDYTVLDGNGGSDIGAVNLSISALPAGNFIEGTSSGESLSGTSDIDIFDGKAGNDYLSGYAGDDRYLWDIGDANDYIYESGGSADQIVFGAGITTDDVRLQVSSNDLKLHVGSETLNISSQFYDFKYGTNYGYAVESASFADGTAIDLINNLTLTGTATGESINAVHDNNTLIGNGGADYLSGYAGDDSYVWNVGDGNDYIYESGGSADQIVFGAGITADDVRLQVSSNDLKLHIGSETLNISSQFYDFKYGTNYGYAVESASFADGSTVDLVNNLTLTGTATGESINALDDDNTLIGNGGADYLSGYAGDDSYVWNVGDGNDYIYESGGSADQIVFGAGITADDVRLQVSSNDLKLYIGSEMLNISSHFYDFKYGTNYGYAVESSLFEDGSTIDLVNNLTLVGTSAGESINGLGDDNTLIGKAGSDYLYGNAGNDALYGDEGDDYIYGGTGDDVLHGGDGIDMLYGEAGADTFAFDGATAFTFSDNIQDFKLVDGDKLDVSDVLIGYDPLTDVIAYFVQITDNGSHSYLAIDADGGADGFTEVATIFNQTGLTDEEALETAGNLVTV